MGKILKDMMLSAIDRSAEQAKNLVERFDWDKTKKELFERRDQLLKFGDTFIDDVRKTLNSIEVGGEKAPSFVIKDGKATFEVPYSKADGDKLKWKITDRTLIVRIERETANKSSIRSYSNTIPEGYQTEPSKIGSSKTTGKSYFIFLPEDEEDEFETL